MFNSGKALPPHSGNARKKKIFLQEGFPYSEHIFQLNFSSYHGLSYSPYSYTPHHLPYYAAHLSIPAFGLHGLPYNGLPYSGVPAYSSLPTLVYNTLAPVSTEVEEEE